MDFDWSPEEKAFREEAAAYIQEHLTEGVVNEGCDATRYVDTPERRGFMRALADCGYLGVSWPEEYGGKGLPITYDYLLAEELAAAGAPQSGKGVGIIGQTLIRHGSDELKAEFLPKILRGEIEWAIGYSEPDAGSDLASLKLRATRDGEGWRLNGQKRFTTSAHFADWYWLAARTDPEAPKHRGITLFIVPMNDPGITVQEMRCIDGERTNEVFLDDVWVSDRYAVGEVNKGFNYVSEALDYERHTLFPYSMLPRMFEMFLEFVKTTQRDGVPLRDDPAVRRTVAELARDMEVARMNSIRVVDNMVHGLPATVPAAMNKVWWSELYQRLVNAVLEIVGPGAWLRRGSAHAPMEGFFQQLYRTMVIPAIGAGANEIQRTIIARRGLGLPNPI
ncbi:MAG: acyl-CoA dehydrogenase family protein [Acidimicrobiia bacterium]|nr:acyl-CoA dehydrogenase family protein [Acidimicrobiia bacterium]